MPRDEMDVYQIVIGDTNEINRRRQMMDSLYVAVISLILSGDAYAAFTSRFDSWVDVAVTAGTGIVGFLVTARWRQALKDLDKILEHRYEFLRNLEALPALSSLGAAIYTREYEKFYKDRPTRRFRSATKRLQTIFQVVFVLIPIALAALTAVHTIPSIDHYIPRLTMFIQPLYAALAWPT